MSNLDGPPRPAARLHVLRWLAMAGLAGSAGALIVQATVAIDAMGYGSQTLHRVRDLTAIQFSLLPVRERPTYAWRLLASGKAGMIALTQGGRVLAGAPEAVAAQGRFRIGDQEMTGEHAAIGDSEWLYIAMPARSAAQSLSWMIALDVLILFVGGASVIWLALGLRSARGRSRQLAQAIDAIGRGRLQTRLPVVGDGGAMDRLSAQVNDMVTRLAQLMSLLQEQSDHIRHEYGNSAGRMGVYLNRIRAYEGPLPPVINGAIAALERERRHFIALTEAILSLWRARQGGQQMHEQDLAILAGESADVFEMKADEKLIRLEINLQPAKMMGDARMLSLMITNLLDNAIKYTPAGGRVYLACIATGDAISLTVDDSGPGIPVEQRGRVFATRHRLSDTEIAPGNGYGLAIVEAIVTLHRGTITVQDSTFGGALFQARFPRS